ncbi:MAG: hypothetical protein EON52_22035 [Actinomycetales bacterium]|nr:MAG: hypothetical protein EON52_22035 [Actinomycetales bacterium]
MRRRVVWRGFPVITVVTVLLGCLALVVAVRLPSPTQQREVDAADRAAGRYAKALDADLVAFGESTRDDVADHLDDLDQALALVRRHVTAVPRISTRGTTAYGRSHSLEYRAAKGRRSLALRPFVQLVRVLEGAVQTQGFIRAGTHAIEINPLELLDGTPVLTGEPLRELVVPEYKAARTKLQRHPAPSGSALLGQDLLTYVSGVIATTRDGADDIDAGRPFRFDFGTRPQDLQRRLAQLSASVVSSVLQAVDETAGFGGGQKP